MAYTVLARRYRSQTFDDVVGQDAIAQTLKHAIEGERVAHAYLFTGTRGVGKTTMARILAKSLNCLKAKEPTIKPCLKCDSCMLINTGDDIDVIEIDGASNNKVENVRDLIANSIYRPARSRYKIYIIDEVHMLTASAFNALLKTLEEPPDHVKFIFATTEPNKVLPTIQSRCQRFDFANINHETIGVQLRKILKEEKIEYEEDLIIHLSRLANGSMRDGLSLLDQLISTGSQPLSVPLLTEFLGQPDRRKLYVLVEKMAAQDGAGVLDALEKGIEGGQSAGLICDCLLELFRDLMVLKASGRDTQILILTDQEREELLKLTEGFDLAGLVYAITALEKLRWTIRNSETGRILLEAALLRLTLREHFLGLDQLARQAGGKESDVKKNETVSELSPLPVETSSLPSAMPIEKISGSITLETIRGHWKRVLEHLARQNGGLANYLSQGTPSGFTGDLLTLRFSAHALFAVESCRKREQEIRACLEAVFGRPFTLAFEAAEPSNDSKPAKPQRTEATVDRQERSEVLDDPKVQMILKELNATPMDIQRIALEEEGADAEDEDV